MVRRKEREGSRITEVSDLHNLGTVSFTERGHWKGTRWAMYQAGGVEIMSSVLDIISLGYL